jgi:hypothetical protein
MVPAIEVFALVDESLALTRKIGDMLATALALLILGFSAIGQADYARARGLL